MTSVSAALESAASVAVFRRSMCCSVRGRDGDGSWLLRLRPRPCLGTIPPNADHRVDGDRRSVEVDASPTKRQRLASPATLLGGDPEIGEERRIMILSSEQDPGGLVQRRRDPIAWGELRRRHLHDVVRLDVLHGHRERHDRRQHGSHLADGGRAQSGAFELPKKPRDEPWPQLLDVAIPEEREDVAGEIRLIVGRRRRRQPGPGRPPLVDELAKGQPAARTTLDAQPEVPLERHRLALGRGRTGELESLPGNWVAPALDDDPPASASLLDHWSLRVRADSSADSWVTRPAGGTGVRVPDLRF
jgi:hypothetical protein